MVGTTSRRKGVRNARIAARSSHLEAMLPELTHAWPEVKFLNPEHIARIDAASMNILENIGVIFRDERALADWRATGVKVLENRVYLDREFLRQLLASIPSSFTQHARDPAKKLTIGDKKAVCIPMSGANFVGDFSGLRRSASLADAHVLHKLSHLLPALHATTSHVVTPQDISLPHRHLHAMYSAIVHSDKILFGAANSGKCAADELAMCDVLFGEATVNNHAVLLGTISATAPLLWDANATEALRQYAERGQPVVCSPAVHAGGNTPASTAATVAQVNAHILAVLAYSQVIKAGTPVVYGQTLSTASMRTADAMFGTPEVVHMNAMFSQLARHYGLPWQSSGAMSGAKLLDAQSGYEAAVGINSAVNSGANIISQAAGSSEGGVLCSMAKFVLDAEYCAMAYRMGTGIQWDDFDTAIAAVGDVGPGQRYFGHPHTMAHFEKAFFISNMHDYNSYQLWQAQGAKDVQQRAVEYAELILAEYQAPALDQAIDEALLEFIAKRESNAAI